MSSMMPYERLDAWSRSHELVLLVYRVTQSWPKNELYGLISQTRRSAFSIPVNIAEGVAKKGSREFRRFLDIALGSFSELTYCLRLANDLGYICGTDATSIEELRSSVGKLLWRLYESISRSASRT